MLNLKKSIAAKLILFLLLNSIFLSVIAMFVRFYEGYTQEMSILDKRQEELKQSAIPVMVDSVWLADWDMVRVQAQGIQRLPLISRVEVVIDNKEIAAFGTKMTDENNRIAFPLNYRYKERDIHLGTLTLYVDKDTLRRQVLDTVLSGLAARLIAIFIISGLLLYLFHRIAGRHLIAIADQLRTFSHGKLGTPLVLDKAHRSKEEMDEIDQVVFSFNEMQQNLQQSFDALNKANTELRENRTMLRQILDTAPQAIFWKDCNSVYLGCNKVFAKDIGLDDPEKIIGKTDFDLPWPKVEADAYRADDREVIITRQSKQHIIEPLQKADSTRIWIDTTKVPLRDEQGNAFGVLGAYSDITERIRAEEEKARLESQLRQSQKMEAIGTLAGGIAHDFNNILAVILGYTELAMLTPNRDKVMGYLSEVCTASERARDLVKQILIFSRKMEQPRQPLQVSSVIKETLKMLRASIQTTIEIRQDLRSEAKVLAEPIQIQQMLMNLCTNASHAMMLTGGVLSVSLTEVAIKKDDNHATGLPPGIYLKLEVSDTGCGIDPAIQDKIFEPFFTTKEKGKGTGMGLAVVHGIVQSHNGHITVQSEKGKGTSFQVYLPIIEDDTISSIIDETPPPVHTGKGQRILIVDDEEQIRSMMATMLDMQGYQVTVCPDGLEALHLFETQPEQFDVVITDMTMPQMNGAELAKRILAIRPEMPIILCTGQSPCIDREKALEMGICEYLEKPIHGNALLETINKVLNLSI